MAANIFSVDYYTATVEDKPGEGSQFLKWLASEEVNLLAFSAHPIGSRLTRLTIYPLNATWMAHAARKRGIRLTGPHHGFIVHGDDELGALQDLHQILASAHINVSTSNGIVDGRGGYRYILHVEPEQFEHACETLNVDQSPKRWQEFVLNLRRRHEAKA